MIVNAEQRQYRCRQTDVIFLFLKVPNMRQTSVVLPTLAL